MLVIPLQPILLSCTLICGVAVALVLRDAVRNGRTRRLTLAQALANPQGVQATWAEEPSGYRALTIQLPGRQPVIVATFEEAREARKQLEAVGVTVRDAPLWSGAASTH